MNKLSIVILTYNSERYLKEVLSSCQFADETLILDSGSTDKTVEIANQFDAKIIHQSWLGFGKQKQRAVSLASYKWVFVLDSDEVITLDLQQEILTVLKAPKANGFFVPRLNYFFKKPVKTMGLYPDSTTRLFDKTKGRFSDDAVHERVLLEGKAAALSHHMLHYAYENIEQFIAKQNKYSTLGAKSRPFKALFSPYWTFFKLFVLKGGFREGWHGFIIAKLYAQYTFWKYIK